MAETMTETMVETMVEPAPAPAEAAPVPAEAAPAAERPRSPPQRHRPWTVATVSGVASLVLPSIALLRLYIWSRLSTYIIWYGCLVSGITFLMYGYDKMQAQNLQWRVKETTLQTLALVGGWPGALAGMHYFQHKTRKTKFQVVFWGIVLGWEGVAWMVCKGGVRLL